MSWLNELVLTIYPSTLGGGGAAGLESAVILFFLLLQPGEKTAGKQIQNRITNLWLKTDFTIGLLIKKMKDKINAYTLSLVVFYFSGTETDYKFHIDLTNSIFLI